MAEGGSQSAGGDAEASSPIGVQVPQFSVQPVTLPTGVSVQERTLEDWARFWLAASFVVIFALTVVIVLIIVWNDSRTWPSLKELLEILIPAEAALLGSATGFYFGSRERRAR